MTVERTAAPVCAGWRGHRQSRRATGLPLGSDQAALRGPEEGLQNAGGRHAAWRFRRAFGRGTLISCINGVHTVEQLASMLIGWCRSRSAEHPCAHGAGEDIPGEQRPHRSLGAHDADRGREPGSACSLEEIEGRRSSAAGLDGLPRPLRRPLTAIATPRRLRPPDVPSRSARPRPSSGAGVHRRQHGRRNGSPLLLRLASRRRRKA